MFVGMLGGCGLGFLSGEGSQGLTDLKIEKGSGSIMGVKPEGEGADMTEERAYEAMQRAALEWEEAHEQAEKCRTQFLDIVVGGQVIEAGRAWDEVAEAELDALEAVERETLEAIQKATRKWLELRYHK